MENMRLQILFLEEFDVKEEIEKMMILWKYKSSNMNAMVENQEKVLNICHFCSRELKRSSCEEQFSSL